MNPPTFRGRRCVVFSLCLATLSILSSTVSSPLQSASIYYWIDENGQRHYTDNPNSSPAASNVLPYQIQQPMQRIAGPELPVIYPKQSNTKQRSNRTKKAKKKQRQKLDAASAKQRRKCEGYTNKIRQINAKLRKGHSNAQGNRWREDRRRHQQLRWKQCR